MKFRRTTIEDVIGKLAGHQALDGSRLEGNKYDFYIQAIGFEERTLSISQKLASAKNVSVGETILIRYKTNQEDNQVHEKKIRENTHRFSATTSTIVLDDQFKEIISQKVSALTKSALPRVIVDFSSLSSRVILMLTRILFTRGVDLTVVYAEGAVYHPTEAEFGQILKKKNLEKLSQTYGVDEVVISPDYNGGPKENQDLVVCFPSFKAERTLAIITSIDDLILKQNDKERLIWMIGDPHMEEPAKTRRREIQKQINNLTEEDKVYGVCTMDYKKTLALLDHVYRENAPRYHINISDLGSKMQSFAISLFCMLRRDVTVYYSEPVSYNPSHYSEGVKDLWMIEIGDTREYLKYLLKVDLIEHSDG